MNEKETHKARPKTRIQKINRETEQKPKAPKKERVKLSARIEHVKTGAKQHLDAYLDRRKEELNRNDAVFSETLTEAKREKVVLRKGGIDKGFLISVLLLLIFGK